MNCYQLNFLSISIWGRITNTIQYNFVYFLRAGVASATSTLSRRLIFPRRVGSWVG